MAKKKYKRMTAAEKKWNKEFREELREKGIIPPVKPRLNRKKFLQEAFREYDETIKTYHDMVYLARAITWTVGRDQDKNITTEQVGVLKVMKLAAAIKAFEEQKSENGETTYTIGEIYEQVVRPIQSL